MNIQKSQYNSLRFKRNSESFKNTSSFHVIFQRFNKYKYLSLVCKSPSQNKSGNDEDIILFEKQDALNEADLLKFFENNDVESGVVVNLDQIGEIKEITSLEFKNACLSASRTCHRFARLFLVIEIITKMCDLFLLAVLPLSEKFHLTQNGIIISLVILVPMILMQVMCDWGKLLEKYSRLCNEFYMLSCSKSDDKFDLYEKLVYNFRSSWICADAIIPVTSE